MSNIENRVVEMRFDNKQFEDGVKTSLSTLDRLKRALKFDKSADSLNNLNKATKSFTMDDMAKNVEKVADRFSVFGIVGMRVIQNLTDAAMRLGHRLTSAITQPLIQGGIQRASDIKQAQFMIEGLGQDWEAVSKSVSESVNDTAYGFDEAAKAAAQFGASGIQAGEDMTHALLGVAGTAAMTGAEYSSIADIFTTVAGNGRLMTMQLNQLSYRGLNAASVLGEQLGKTEAEIREMVHEGEIDFKTFANAMYGAFGEHAKDANKTFTGALANMKAALKRIGADFADPAMDNLRDVFNVIKDIINNIHTAMTPIIDFATKNMEKASKYTVGILNNINDAIKDVFGIVDKKAKPAVDAVDKVNSTLEKTEEKTKNLKKLVEQVINGDYGNGEERVKKLGDQYAEVQNEVNKLLGSSKRYAVASKKVDDAENKNNKTKKTNQKLTAAINKDTKESIKTGSKAKTTNEKLVSVFSGLISAAKIVRDVVTNVYNILIKPVAVKILGTVLTFASNIGDKVTNLYSNLKKTNAIENTIKSIRDTLSKIPKAIVSITNKVKGFKPLQTMLQGFFSMGRRIISWIVGLKSRITGLFETLKNMPGVQHLLDVLGKIGDIFGNLMSKGFDKLGGVFSKLGSAKVDIPITEALPKIIDLAAEKLATFLELLMKGAGYAKDFLGGFGEKASGSVHTLTDELGGLGDKIGKVKDKADGMFGPLKKFFSRIADNSEGIYDNAKKAAGNLAKGLVDGFKGINLDKVLNWAKVGAQIFLIYKTIKFMETLGDAVTSVQSIPKKIAGVFGALADTITAYQKTINATVVEKIGTAILKIAAAMLIISGIPTDQLTTITGDLVLILMGIAGVMMAIAKITAAPDLENSLGKLSEGLSAFLTGMLITFKRAATLIGVALLFVGFAAAVAVIAKAFVDLSVAVKDLSKNKGSMVAAGGLLILFAMMVASSAATLSVAAKDLNAGVGVALIGFAGSLALLAQVIKILGKMKIGELAKGTVAISALMLVMGKMTSMTVGAGGDMLKASVGMMVMSAAIVALIGPLLILSRLSWDSIAKGLVTIVVAFGSLAGVSAIMKKFGSGAKELIVMAGAITLLAVAMRIFAPAADAVAPAMLSLMALTLFMASGAVIMETFGAGLEAFALVLLQVGASFVMFGAGAALFGVAVMAIGKGLSLIGQGFVDFVNGLIEALQTVTENKDTIAQGILDVITSISTGILKAVPAIIQGAAAFFMGIAIGLSQAIPTIVTAIGALLTQLSLGIISGVDMLARVCMVGIIQGLNTIAQFLVDNDDALIEAIMNVMLAIAVVVVSMVQKTITTVLGILHLDKLPFFKNAIDAIGNFKDSLEKQMSYEEGNKLTSQYMQGANDGVANNKQPILAEVDGLKTDLDSKVEQWKGGNWTGFLTDPLKEDAEKAKTELPTMYDDMLSKLKELGDSGTETGQFLNQGLGTGIQESMDIPVGATEDTADAINEQFASVLGIQSPSTVFEGHGKNIISGLTNGITKNMGQVTKPIATLANKLSKSMSGKASGFAKAGKSMITGLINGLKSGSATATKSLNTIVKNCEKAITSKISQFRNAGRKLMEGLRGGISAMGSSVASATRSVADRARNAASGKRDSFYSIGQSMMEGMKSGIESKAAEVGRAAAKAAINAKNKAKAAIRSNSPAKAFIPIGESMDEGMIVGIRNLASQVSAAGAKMAKGPLEKAKKVIASSTSVFDDMNFDPVLRPVVDMSGVYASADELDALFGSQAFNMYGNLSAVNRMMANRQNGSNNSDVVSAINKLNNGLSNLPTNNFHVGSVTYDDGSNVADAVGALIRAIKVEGRM